MFLFFLSRLCCCGCCVDVWASLLLTGCGDLLTLKVQCVRFTIINCEKCHLCLSWCFITFTLSWTVNCMQCEILHTGPLIQKHIRLLLGIPSSRIKDDEACHSATQHQTGLTGSHDTEAINNDAATFSINYL